MLTKIKILKFYMNWVKKSKKRKTKFLYLTMEYYLYSLKEC